MSNNTQIAFDYYGGGDVEMGKREGSITCEDRVIIAAYPLDSVMFISDGQDLWCVDQLEYYTSMNRFLSA